MANHCFIRRRPVITGINRIRIFDKPRLFLCSRNVLRIRNVGINLLFHRSANRVKGFGIPILFQVFKRFKTRIRFPVFSGNEFQHRFIDECYDLIIIARHKPNALIRSVVMCRFNQFGINRVEGKSLVRLVKLSQIKKMSL